MNDPRAPLLRLRWFGRGLFLGLLLAGTANAVSYFFRSDGWGSLLGNRQAGREAIGFPLELWRSGTNYGGLFIDSWGLAINALAALALGTLLGLWSASRARWLETMLRDFERREQNKAQQNFQFTVGGLMVATVLSAIVAWTVKEFATRPESLWVIYVLGPAGLVLLALLPHRIAWQQRVAILTPATLAMIAVALWIGASLGIEFDVVLMGIYICWVPQTMLAAIVLMSHHMLRYRREGA
ncbi:hypothetical protein [Roseimaritima sediminicola]|uniref:hypothetical protein n=1 Tax=Roseimaritima sediminicola TaxID=2662066 RepID=UPI00129833A8|nr:hypothetical protein [Roseimaritima sediminicola]